MICKIYKIFQQIVWPEASLTVPKDFRAAFSAFAFYFKAKILSWLIYCTWWFIPLIFLSLEIWCLGAACQHG